MISRVFYFSILVIISACSSSDGKDSAKGKTDPNAKTGTQEMADRLVAIYQNANPIDYYNLNTRRAEYYKGQMEMARDPQTHGQMQYLYGLELMQSGKSKEAIAIFETMLGIAQGTPAEVNEESKFLWEMLAIANLRMGEQENCIMNHTGVSCILPLQEPGIHKMRTGSEKAIEVYTKILEKFPDDYNSRWLINVAYVTLGEYPQGVPSAWRLPASAFAGKSLIPRFENIATELGIDTDGLAGGACVEDFNNDGHLDILASSYGLRDQLRFFINNGDGSFTERTEQAGLTGLTSGLNMVHADYNNDGFADVLILRGAWLGKAGAIPHSLLKNNGNGTFEDVTRAAGMYSEHPTQNAGWADVNLDGNLDLFIGNESTTGNPHPCEFYINNGDGTFTESGAKYGLNVVAFVKGCGWADVDHNGRPDLYISLLNGPNKLFLNQADQNPNGFSFIESAALAGVQEPMNSFPTWFCDYDNDGWADLFVCGYDMVRLNNVAEDEWRALTGLSTLAETPRLYHNNGDGTFTNVTKGSGLDRPLYGMGSNYGDINMDGYLDFYVGTGAPDLRSIVPNRMFLNRNGKSFVDVTNEGGFGHIQKGHGVSFGDLDRDGDEDIYEVIGGAVEGDNFRNALFNNPSTGKWIVIQLSGTKSNRSAIGAVVKVEIIENGKSRNIYRTVTTGGSFGSSSLQLEIGLGTATIVKSLEVIWPNRDQSRQTFTDIEIGKKYLLKEGGKLENVEYTAVEWKLTNSTHHHH